MMVSIGQGLEDWVSGAVAYLLYGCDDRCKYNRTLRYVRSEPENDFFLNYVCYYSILFQMYGIPCSH